MTSRPLRRVLCLFYYFPPTGGAGALRCLGYARGLLARGWEPTVVTPAGTVYHTPGGDLLPALPPGIRVQRTGNLEIRNLFSPLRWIGLAPETIAALARTVSVPDYQAGWIPFAGREAGRLLASGSYDALLSSGAPWSAHLVARGLARRHRLPWLATFADEWSTATEVSPPSSLHRRLNRRLEGRVLREASAVAIATATMAKRLAEAHPDIPARIDIVDNGYHEEDFAGKTRSPSERFTLLYGGSIYPTTDPSDALRSLALLLERRPALRSRIRFRILGYRHPPFEALAARLGLVDLLSLEGPRPHGDVVQAMLDADVLVDARAAHPSAAAMRPVKLFEYLRAARPVLGYYPPGEAADLMAPFAGCVRVDPGDAAAGARALEDWLLRWEKGELGTLPRPGIERLSRSVQEGRLADLLDRIAGTGA